MLKNSLNPAFLKLAQDFYPETQHHISKECIERFLYDLEMKTRKQNRNNKRTERERFDWFIERIQMHVARNQL